VVLGATVVEVVVLGATVVEVVVLGATVAEVVVLGATVASNRVADRMSLFISENSTSLTPSVAPAHVGHQVAV